MSFPRRLPLALGLRLGLLLRRLLLGADRDTDGMRRRALGGELVTSSRETVEARSKSGPCCVQKVPVPDMLAREYSFASDVT